MLADANVGERQQLRRRRVRRIRSNTTPRRRFRRRTIPGDIPGDVPGGMFPSPFAPASPSASPSASPAALRLFAGSGTFFPSKYTTSRMPDWITSFAHSLQGYIVTYSVAPTKF